MECAVGDARWARRKGVFTKGIMNAMKCNGKCEMMLYFLK